MSVPPELLQGGGGASNTLVVTDSHIEKVV
jgi:hypothetical protein